MTIIRSFTTPANTVEVEGGVEAYRSALTRGRGNGYSVATTTGTIGAALAANSAIYAQFLSPSAPVAVYIERVRIEYTCIVAFTVPITARRLALVKGGGFVTAFGGGNSFAALGQIVPKRAIAGHQQSWCSNINGGEIRISSTAALTFTGLLAETTSMSEMALTANGTSGSFKEYEYTVSDKYVNPIILLPSQFFMIRNPVVFDAAGTWTASIYVDWYEAPLL
jgi:hypothetical protein